MTVPLPAVVYRVELTTRQGDTYTSKLMAGDEARKYASAKQATGRYARVEVIPPLPADDEPKGLLRFVERFGNILRKRG